MQANQHIAMSRQERLNGAMRATGQKNYVHARMQAEQTQMNALLGTPSARLRLAALHTDDRMQQQQQHFSTTK